MLIAGANSSLWMMRSVSRHVHNSEGRTQCCGLICSVFPLLSAASRAAVADKLIDMKFLDFAIRWTSVPRYSLVPLPALSDTSWHHATQAMSDAVDEAAAVCL
jgi:hypothetical protein